MMPLFMLVLGATLLTAGMIVDDTALAHYFGVVGAVWGVGAIIVEEIRKGRK